MDHGHIHFKARDINNIAKSICQKYFESDCVKIRGLSFDCNTSIFSTARKKFISYHLLIAIYPIFCTLRACRINVKLN